MGIVPQAFAIATLVGQVSLAMLKRSALSLVTPLQAAVWKAPVCVLMGSLDPLAKTASAPRIVGDMGIAFKVSASALLNGLGDPVN